MIRRRFRTGKRLLTSAVSISALVAGVVVVAARADAATNHNPVGTLQWVKQSPDGIAVRGWAYDADLKGPVTVQINVDGAKATAMQAGLYGTGLPAGYGGYRFFGADIPQPAGTHLVCAYAKNAPATSWFKLGCITFTVTFDPIGSFTSIKQVPGHVDAQGWAFDPNAPTTALTLHLTVDGKVVASGLANQPRADVASAHPDAGPNHGVSLEALISEATHKVCLTADNIGLGSSRALGCYTKFFNFSPIGAITKIGQRPGSFHITGWASDPDTNAPITVRIVVGTATLASLVANGPAPDGVSAHNGHGFAADVNLISPMPPGTRRICVWGFNLSTYGSSRTVACQTHTFDFNPKAGIDSAAQKSPGITVSGWARDPDTTSPIKAQISLDGTTVQTITASAMTGSHPGYGFTTVVPATNGAHTVCVVGINVLFGTGNSAKACSTVSLNFNPFGAFETATRVSTSSSSIKVTGWAIDPDTSAPISVHVIVDGKGLVTTPANLVRTDLAKSHPGTGTAHGFSIAVPADQFEHTVCMTAINVLGGDDNKWLGCKIVIAVHPKVPGAPGSVTATAGYGGAVVTWVAPTTDGGAPWSGYTVTSSPGGISVHAAAAATSATVLGLKPSTAYTFTVVANNVAGASPAGTSNSTTTQAQPPPQTTPAPISTSRYVRNISSADTSDTATMFAEGQADAIANPSGHGYMILLDIGGQDESRGGVLLSATINFVTYSALVTNLKAYVDGYASKQKASAPITIAIGTNNDVDVSTSAGANWADKVVDPVVAYARKYPGVVIAGADDIEPGFTATYTQTKAWLSGYLGATTAPFVFNGSADGCSWTTTASSCNNGWSESALFYLAGGAAPTRIINLPQIYNTTMAKQWRYISLTGVNAGRPRINFGGALTEWTACQQASGCGSLTGNSAWTQMWSELRAEPKLVINSLPYSTDLRIDR